VNEPLPKGRPVEEVIVNQFVLVVTVNGHPPTFCTVTLPNATGQYEAVEGLTERTFARRHRNGEIMLPG